MPIETPNTLGECESIETVRAFFEAHNDFDPATYARLALRKLRPSNPFIDRDDVLLPEQEGALVRVAGGAGDWGAYCSALTYRQVQCVGW